MGVVNPGGCSVVIGGVERHLLFTLSVIDELQSFYDKPISEILTSLMMDERQALSMIGHITTVLVNDEIRRSNHFERTDLPLLTEEEVNWLVDIRLATGELLEAILKAYGVSAAINDEDDDPNLTRSPRS